MQNILDFIVPLFVLISVIAGMINSVKQAAAKNPAAPPPRAPMTPAQESMGRFLDGLPPEDRQQTTSQRPQNQPNQGSRQQQQRQKQNQKKNSQKQPAASQQQQPKKVQKPRTVGSGVSEHVDSFIGDHVRSHMGRDVDNFVKKDIDERVRSHLGSQSSKPVEMSASDTGSAAADDILSVLKTPAGVRHAILVHEILSRPRSLRKK
jgi:hypothetical protein